jgi:predicted HAD superfamily hydrolase
MLTSPESILTQYSDKIKILSLDCFDTLLWRKVATAQDVFYDLQHRPAFKALGITASERVQAEQLARRIVYARFGIGDVRLSEIYRLGLSWLSEDQIHALMEDELAEEIETCYTFPATNQLILDAQSLGLKIIIVSNTYLEENQLRRLLAAVLPQATFAAIDMIFCSCEFGLFKQAGLFKKVLQKLSVPANHILHLGDQEVDLIAPSALGMHALRLVQDKEIIAEIFRLQVIAGTIADPTIRDTHSMPCPFRALFSMTDISKDKPEQLIAYVSLGPIMYAFARHIFSIAEQVRHSGKNPRILFIMRDAYLPSLACEVLAGEPIGKKVLINRFVTIAASFRNPEDVLNYLLQFSNLSSADYCRQFLLQDELAHAFHEIAKNASNQEQLYLALIQNKEILKSIFKNSAAFRLRLKRYLEKEIELKKGDTVILVDLVASGSTQYWLTPLFLEMGADDVIGCYFCGLHRTVFNLGGKKPIKHYFLSPEHPSIFLLEKRLSLLEAMCNSLTDSVIDFDDDGNPATAIRFSVNSEHMDKVKRIQNECLSFIQDAKNHFNNIMSPPPISMLRDITLAELVRHVYLSTDVEMDYLNNFNLEDNYSLKQSSMSSNAQQQLHLLHRGIGFLQLPYKIHFLRRVANLDFMIALMTKHRLNLMLSTNDRNLQQETLTAKMTTSSSPLPEHIHVPMMSTVDGFLAAIFPLQKTNTAKISIEVLYGIKYEWLQIDSVELIKEDYFSVHESLIDIREDIAFNKMAMRGKNLFECLSQDSSLVIPLTINEDSILRIIFRPIIRH